MWDLLIGLIRLGTQALALLPIGPDEHELCRAHSEALESSLNRAISLLGERATPAATARPPDVAVAMTSAAAAELLGAVRDVVQTCARIEAERITITPTDPGGAGDTPRLGDPQDDESGD